MPTKGNHQLCLVLLSLTFLVACKGVAPADYIKQVATFEDGDGFRSYFVLAAKDGTPTASDGEVTWTLVPVDKYHMPEDDIVVKHTVKATDFRVAKVGLGAFERDLLLYAFPRIPLGSTKFGQPYTVKVHFKTPDGKEMDGEASFTW